MKSIRVPILSNGTRKWFRVNAKNGSKLVDKLRQILLSELKEIAMAVKINSTESKFSSIAGVCKDVEYVWYKLKLKIH
jgi:hypothetical protein